MAWRETLFAAGADVSARERHGHLSTGHLGPVIVHIIISPAADAHHHVMRCPPRASAQQVRAGLEDWLGGCIHAGEALPLRCAGPPASCVSHDDDR